MTAQSGYAIEIAKIDKKQLWVAVKCAVNEELRRQGVELECSSSSFIVTGTSIRFSAYLRRCKC